MSKKKKSGKRGPSQAPAKAAAATLQEPAASKEPLWRQVLAEPVALCLIAPIILRPWLDGITYPTDNFYFVWYSAILFAVWAVRLLLRGEPVRSSVPIALLAAFFIIAALTGFNTIQVNATYRMIIIWAGYFFLFVLATNALRTKLGVGIVLGATLIALLSEAFWSLLHLKYVLPYVRQMLTENPSYLMEYFGVSEVSPELAHRLETNRAFGSLLFPNALGAFLILIIPYAVAGTLESLRTIGPAWRETKTTASPVTRGYHALIIGSIGFLGALGLAFFLFTFFAFFAYPGEDWTNHMGAFFCYVVLVPTVFALPLAALTRYRGAAHCGIVVRTAVFSAAALSSVAALWWTFSRGAILGLTIASMVSATLLFYEWFRAAFSKLIKRTAAALLLGLAAAYLLTGGPIAAQDEKPASTAGESRQVQAQTQPAAKAKSQLAAKPDIDLEGREIGAKELAQTGSMRLRLSYWRAGWRMAKTYFWTGVGLGNFRTAYPNHQAPIDGDVKMAHNDYLQILCETGIFGALAFCAFWAYFAVWGARRIIALAGFRKRLVPVGLYAGVLAFLLHSIVDFNFYNPSLAYYAFLLAGVFYHITEAPASAGAKKLRRQLVAVPLLIGVALVSGMTLRVYLSDFVAGGGNFLNVGDEKVSQAKLRVAQFLIEGAEAALRNKE